MSKRVRLVVGIIMSILLIFALFFVSLTPAVALQDRASPQDLQAARLTWDQLERARGVAPMQVRVDNSTMLALSTLAGNATGLNRVTAGVSQGELQGQVSIPLPLGLWINASAATAGTHSGFPSYRLSIGRLHLPAAAGRVFADLARWALQMKGATIPPLDEVVQNLSVERDHVVATMHLPRKTGVFDKVVPASTNKINPVLVRQILCRIAAAQRAEPVTTLFELVRRTFSGAATDNSSDFNRAAFVALSSAVVGQQADMLTPGAAELRTRCNFPEGAVLLQGRADLAKHWVFSAALTSALGAQAAESLGELKELDDSRPSGSGFSFVDLAADRAGVQTALLAVEPRSATGTAEELSRATEDYLLPRTLLKAPEGLSDAAFVARFGTRDQEGYRQAVSRIDQILAQQRASN